jgi:hypothetical protein
MSSVQIALKDRSPARVDDVDQHQRVVVWEVDDNVVRRVIGTVPGQVDGLTADLQRAAVLEGLLVWRPRRVVVAHQQSPRLLVPDAGHVPGEQ